METSTIIFTICIIICVISMILLFIKLNNISETIEINQLESKIPSSLTLDKLKVKDLEVENNLMASNINSENDSLSINSNVELNKDLHLNGDKLKVNPKMIINTSYNYADDSTKDDFINKKLQYLYIDDSDDSNMDMNLHLDEIAYYMGTSYKERIKRMNKNKKEETSIGEYKPINFIPISNDNYYMYDESGDIIGCMAVDNNKLTKFKPRDDVEYIKPVDYEDEYNLYDNNKQPIIIKKFVKQLNLNDNDVIEITKELKEHLDFGNQLRANNPELFNTNFYPIQLIDKVKNGQFKIKGEEYNPPAVGTKIENFSNIPSFEIYYYY